jgi:hypothetical protein
MIKEYKHENGYSAVLYGKSSLSVDYKGNEVLHTGFRNVNTEEEVMELLEGMPEFMKKFSEIYNDEEVAE